MTESVPALIALHETLSPLTARPRVPLDPQRRFAVREHVYAAADALRARGLTPERALIALKETVATAGLRAGEFPGLPGLQSQELYDLVSDVSRWCIERYFAGDALV